MMTSLFGEPEPDGPGLPGSEEAPFAWPSDAPARYGYLVARHGPPAPVGFIGDVVLDGAGLYLAGSTEHLAVRVRVVRLELPELPVVPTGVTLVHGRLDASLWEAIVERARAAMPHEVLVAVVARDPREGEVPLAAAGPYVIVEPQLDETGRGDWQPQRASGCRVQATPVADAVLELHSHHAMPAYFSPTDDRDERARRIYGVLGRLDAQSPEVALRVATGCRPHAVQPVRFEDVFVADRGAFRDVQFDPPFGHEGGAGARRGMHQARHAAWTPSAGVPLLLETLLRMAEDLAVVRGRADALATALLAGSEIRDGSYAETGSGGVA